MVARHRETEALRVEMPPQSHDVCLQISPLSSRDGLVLAFLFFLAGGRLVISTPPLATR